MNDLIALMRGGLYSLWYALFRRNIRIGGGLKVYRKLRISGPGKVEIGRTCRVDGIKGDSGQYVSIDSLEPDSAIHIGDNARLYAARISSRFLIRIGNDFLIEESGVIDTDFHALDRSRGRPADETVEKCRVSIGDRVSIGARSVVTKGVAIGDDVVVAPASVVTSSLKAGMVVSGNPAKPLRGNVVQNP